VAWRNGRRITVDGVPAAPAGVRLVPLANGIVMIGHGAQRHVALKSYDSIDVDHLDGDGAVKAPMHGKVLAIFVEQGASVIKGERVAVVEAMKMEHALLAPLDGTVVELAVEVGAQIAEGTKILMIEATQKEG
jgi:3-methylcrotonyl-CoA carboxylase alpha subunit